MGKKTYSLEAQESVFSAWNSLNSAIGTIGELPLTREVMRAVANMERAEKILLAMAKRMDVDLETNQTPQDLAWDKENADG